MVGKRERLKETFLREERGVKSEVEGEDLQLARVREGEKELRMDWKPHYIMKLSSDH